MKKLALLLAIVSAISAEKTKLLAPAAATHEAAPAHADSSQHTIGIIGFTQGTATGRNTPAEFGLTSWALMNGKLGFELTMGYKGSIDDSRTDKKYGQLSNTTTATTSTVVNTRDDGSIVRDVISSGSVINISLMPKYKLFTHKNTFFYVGLPVSMNMKGTERNNITNTSNTWANQANNTGAAPNTSDDYVSAKTVLTTTSETTYNNQLKVGVLLGAATTFESLPGVEIGFAVGFNFATASKTTVANTSSQVDTTYSAAGVVNTTTTTTGATGTVSDGVQRADSSGLGTFSTGEALLNVRIAYYFL